MQNKSWLLATIATALYSALTSLANAADSASPACQALAAEDFTGLDEAPTQITTTRFVESTDGSPAYCRVSGYVWPQVSFELLLPQGNWNGKLFQVGCGGACGSLPDQTSAKWCPLNRGYACITTDTGHRGSGTLWAYHNSQAQQDFGSRATHVTSAIAKVILERYYASAPKYSYFRGCSTGSQQALVEAQRFPGDFDGLIGEGVWIGDIDSSMKAVWGARALRGSDGKSIVTPAQMQMVHQAVLAQCDLDDGLKDGRLSYPPSCKFDPAKLQCTLNGRSGCITAQQVTALQKVYSGPMTSTGEKLSIGGSFPGHENHWVVDSETHGGWGGGAWITSDGRGMLEQWSVMQFRGLVQPPGRLDWKPSDLDFDRDYKRFSYGAKESYIHESNPDLRKFKAAGGKLILSVGWEEWFDPRSAIDYYETVERTMGGREKTQDFFRLFMLPGANHCLGGEGAWAIDYLTYLENWVERGQAPDKMIGAHVAGTTEEIGKLGYPYFIGPDTPVDFTRPVFPYPLSPKYTGRGDPNKAENFKPVTP